MKSRDGQSQREEKSRREKIREEKESEERRCRCAKRQESRETLCFSNDSGGSKSRLAKAAGAELAFWSIRSWGLLRWFCMTGAALRMTWRHFFVAGAVLYFGQMEWKNRKTHWHEAGSAALNFPFLKEVSQNSFFSELSSSKIEEVSQNCFVLDVAKFKKWRSLAELFRFWRCQVQTLRKSHRIAPFLMLSSSKPEDRIVSFSSLQIDR